DGIRDFHVTGVQTCALPISALREMGLSAGEVDIRSRGLEAVLRTLRDAQIDVVDAARLVDSRNAAALITLAEGVDEWKAMTEERSEERRVGKGGGGRGWPRG